MKQTDKRYDGLIEALSAAEEMIELLRQESATPKRDLALELLDEARNRAIHVYATGR